MKINKRILLMFYIAGLEDESHWSHKWRELPFIGRYRRIRKFLRFHNKIFPKVNNEKIKF